MSQPTNHAEEKAKAIFDSLTRAGIHRRYHRRNLKEVATPEIINFAMDPSDHMQAGEGVSILGASTRASDCTILLARALHVQGYGTVVTTLPAIWWAWEKDEGLDRFYECRALVIKDFHDGPDSPLDMRQARAIESLLLERLEDSRAVFPQLYRPLTEKGLWSPALTNRLLDANITVEIP